jgi:putative hydrolase of the HAD superfamily
MDPIEKKFIQQYIRRLAPIPTAITPAGGLPPNIRCVLFDLYGTLFISGSGDISLSTHHRAQMKKIGTLLTKYNIRKAPRELLDEFHGAIKARHTELRNRGIDYPEVRIDQIWQQVLQADDQRIVRQFAIEFELISKPVYPMPALAELLSACRRFGLLMGIISNAQFFTPYLFKWFLDSDPQGLGFNSELIFYSYRFQVAKPSVALFEMAATALSANMVAAASVLYCGNDMLNDIYPAARAGFKTALFAGDRRSLRLRADDSRCRDLKPDLVLTDLRQLIQLITPP